MINPPQPEHQRHHPAKDDNADPLSEKDGADEHHPVHPGDRHAPKRNRRHGLDACVSAKNDAAYSGFQKRPGADRPIITKGDSDTLLPARQISGSVWGMRADSITQTFERARKRAGIEDLRFHDLRHEATSRFFEQGFNIMEVASITGHKTLQMLKRYTHLKAEDLAKKMHTVSPSLAQTT